MAEITLLREKESYQRPWWPETARVVGAQEWQDSCVSHIQRAASPVLAKEEMGPLSPSQRPQKGESPCPAFFSPAPSVPTPQGALRKPSLKEMEHSQ